MEKEEIVNKLKALRLDVDGVVVYGSGAMVLRGVKEKASDIDLIARGEVWEECKKMGKLAECESGVGERIIVDEKIEIFNLCPWEKVGDLFKGSDLIEGIRVTSLENVKRYKKERMWEKDKKDLKLIEDFERDLKEQN